MHIISRIAALIIILSTMSGAYAMVKPEEMKMKNNWMETRLSGSGVPFSFRYGGVSSVSLLPTWKKEESTSRLDKNRVQHVATWTDPATGLQIRCETVEYSDFPAVEWTVYLKNTGSENTPILEKIEGLDALFTCGESGEFVLNGILGDSCSERSFEPYRMPLTPKLVYKSAPPKNSGKSTDGRKGWPYYNLQYAGGGVIIAVGWPGQWETVFARNEGDTLRITAGQQLTHLYLKPGEEIRTPLIAILFWQGEDVVRSQNVWRRWYVAHVLPKENGKPMPPKSNVQVGGSLEEVPMLQAYIDAGIQPDFCWRDAGAGGPWVWYPDQDGPYKGGDSWLNTGTWEIDKTKYPDGFRPFSDKIHEMGYEFCLWFEPERVGSPNSWLAKNHPEWLLPEGSHGKHLDEGNPEAREWLINHIDGMIKSLRMDWYREDMNGVGPLVSWRKNDAPDRQGITENFYVQGHLAFWDEIKRRNPGLKIDSCASGGRRNDLETMRRAVPLLRSDFQFPSMENVVEGNQGHTYGLSFWLPWQGTGVLYTDTYSVRSFIIPGFVMCTGEWWKSEDLKKPVIQGYSEWKKAAPYMLGDYYPLTPYSIAHDKWIAWQFNRPESNDGMIQAFRRGECSDDTITCPLSGLNPKSKYEIYNFDTKEKEIANGKELMERGLTIKIDTKPGSAVITYKKVR